MKNKNTIVQVSFKTQTLDDKMLLDWLEEKFDIYVKSNYIKQVLKKEMQREIED